MEKKKKEDNYIKSKEAEPPAPGGAEKTAAHHE